MTGAEQAGQFVGDLVDRTIGELPRIGLADLARNGPTADELSRAKAVLAGGLMMSDESPASRAGRTAAQTLIFGAPIPSEVSVARLRAQTSDDVRAAARRAVAGLAASAVLGPAGAHGAGPVFTDALNA